MAGPQKTVIPREDGEEGRTIRYIVKQVNKKIRKLLVLYKIHLSQHGLFHTP